MRRQIPAEKIERMAKMYREGGTFAEVASRYGLTTPMARKILIEHGVVSRGHGSTSTLGEGCDGMGAAIVNPARGTAEWGMVAGGGNYVPGDKMRDDIPNGVNRYTWSKKRKAG